MGNRAELMEAVLEVYPDGLALLDEQERVVFWNRSAETITGHAGAGLVGRTLPDALQPLTLLEAGHETREGATGFSFVHAQRVDGMDLPAMTRQIVLRDDMGARIGTAAIFRTTGQTSALPHGTGSAVPDVRASQEEMENRLESAYEAMLRERQPLALIWIAVDQGPELLQTHGERARESMVEAVERTLSNALNPGDEIGRWGASEFLILAHIAGASWLKNYAVRLGGVARTTEFRWWGDRVSLTTSMGVAEAFSDEALDQLLRRAQEAMSASIRAGGNHVTLAAGRPACSRS